MAGCSLLCHRIQTLGEKLSSNERKLFHELGWSHTFSCTFNPIGLYNMAVERAFMTRQEGPAVEALRRAITAITTASPLRQTEDFEHIIEFDKEEVHEYVH